MNSLQLVVLNHLVSSAYLFDISSAQSIAASSAIRIGGRIPSLPDDQWVTEVIGWESTAWASLQIAVGDYFTGARARDPFGDLYVKTVASKAEKALCGMQRMRKSGGFV